MTNQVYFEINGTVASVKDIPSELLIVFLSKSERKTKSGMKVEFKFYAVGLSAAVDFCGQLGTCRMRAAQPAIVKDYLMTASQFDEFWRAKYDS